jgi:hypothetical protein
MALSELLSTPDLNELRRRQHFEIKIWGYHSGGYEELCFIEYKAVSSVESQSTLSRNMVPPSSDLKVEATCSSETSVDIQLTIRHYIPQDIPVFFKLRHNPRDLWSISYSRCRNYSLQAVIMPSDLSQTKKIFCHWYSCPLVIKRSY